MVVLIYVIQELSYSYEPKPESESESEKYKLVSIGEVAINIHNVGVYFRNTFNPSQDYFNLISNEHTFQTLTESKKPSDAYRTGIYLSEVEALSFPENTSHNILSESETETKFKLLRCSSNLNGPTDNFRTTDKIIISQVNETAKHYFEEKTTLNHVLAQIYQNKVVVSDDGKKTEKKAKIKDHSDKTKDMPRTGLIAFCTFYKNYSNKTFTDDSAHIKQSTSNIFDYCFRDQTVLTKLRFRLKKMVTDPTLTKQFDVTLYPNSVFIISLRTNRLYTHEIMPSSLSIDKIPTRLGYVIRCSKTDAVHINNQTYIREGTTYTKLIEPDLESIKALKELYYKENMTDELIHYDALYFSMNDGDYKKPII